jgi:AraC-like DNA-binding protein
MDLLIRTNTPMREVAMESGFGSVATFNRVFREKKGCTPTQYRAIYGTY